MARGELQPGSRLPPERELATTLGVSRMTLRQALDGLVQRGLLVRAGGRGTYVAEPEGASRTCARCAPTPTSCAARASSPRPSCWSPRPAAPPLRRGRRSAWPRARRRIASCACAAPAGVPLLLETAWLDAVAQPDLLEHDLGGLAVGRPGLARPPRHARGGAAGAGARHGRARRRPSEVAAGGPADARGADDVRPGRPAAGVRRRLLPRRPHELRGRGARRRDLTPRRSGRGCARPPGRTAARPPPRRRPSRRRCRPRAACRPRRRRRAGRRGDAALDRVAVAAAGDAAERARRRAARTGSEPSATARGSSSSRHASRVVGRAGGAALGERVAADEAARLVEACTAKPRPASSGVVSGVRSLAQAR